MKCPRCKSTGRINHARQSLPCPECQPNPKAWIESAAQEFWRRVEEPGVSLVEIIERHYREWCESVGKGLPL